MRAQSTLLFVGLAGALGLWLWSRTRTASVTVEVADELLGFVDVSAARVKNALSSRGYRNNNPGNLRFIVRNPWNGQLRDDGGYAVYSSPELGTRALGKQLLKYAREGRRTVRDIIATWAPPNENDTLAYMRAVSRELGVNADQVFDVDARLVELARAIARHENGYLDSTYNWEWVRLQ